MNRVTLFAVAAVALCLLGSQSQVLAATADPMDWSAPAAAPQFRDTLDEPTYQRRSEELLKTVDAAALDKPGLPPIGARIIDVKSDSPAEEAGIEPGDVIAHCNGRVVWSNNSLDRTDGQDELVWVSLDGKEHRAKFAPGKIGATWILHRDASRLYRLRPQRDPKWDAHVLTALLAAGKDNELAEAAWFRAITAGYKPDYFSANFGADIAFAANRNGEALAFAWFALQGDAKAGQLIYPDVIYRVLIANYKLEQAIKLWEAYSIPKGTPDALREMIAWHRGRSAEQRQSPSPSQLARTAYVRTRRARPGRRSFARRHLRAKIRFSTPRGRDCSSAHVPLIH